MNYYNEYDPKAAAWLRALIAAGEIPPGEVDERSIVEVKANELARFNQCHFFAGIGGWPYALRLAGWPEDRKIWTGSCPCQPFSCAGKGLGETDERHLWPVFRNLIGQCGPPVVVGEQVASKAGREWLAGIRAELEAVAYVFGAADLCVAGVGAPHIRQRLYWVAHSASLPSAKQRTESRQWESPGPSHAAECSGLGGMDNTTSARRHGTLQKSESEARNKTRLRLPGEASGTRGLADADGSESGHRQLQSCGRLMQQPQDETALRVGNADGARPQGRNQRRHGADERTPWAASVALACTDGKSRRIEPGSFPLAHGVPDRVGLLRGYGNAIVPQLAAEFIQAACEAFR